MRRWIGLALAGIGLVAGGAALGWAARTPRLSATLYAQNRLVAIQIHLDEAAPDYVLVAGDSQAELQSPAERACGVEIVNGGVSGSTAPVYAELLTKLTIPGRPRAVALTIGTNDLNRKNDPRGPEAVARFEDAATRIVMRLRAASDHVVVTALPPIGRNVGDRLDAAAIGVYSDRLRALCQRLGCGFADPYADLRDGESGYALPGAMRDGLHLAAYRPVLRALAPVLCRAGIPGQP